MTNSSSSTANSLRVNQAKAPLNSSSQDTSKKTGEHPKVLQNELIVIGQRIKKLKTK
jgi:hypothetical protein